MDKKIVGNCACPSCVAKGRDRTSNHLIIFEKTDGSRFGWCSRCKHLENPLGDTITVTPKRVWSEDELQERLNAIQEYPIQELEARKIPQWVCEYYGVRVGLSEEDGVTQREHYYPRYNDNGLCRYNVRLVQEKAFFSIGPQGYPFGFDTLFKKGSSRIKLFIFEDELSTMTGYVVLKAASKPEQMTN